MSVEAPCPPLVVCGVFVYWYDMFITQTARALASRDGFGGITLDNSDSHNDGIGAAIAAFVAAETEGQEDGACEFVLINTYGLERNCR